MTPLKVATSQELESTTPMGDFYVVHDVPFCSVDIYDPAFDTTRIRMCRMIGRVMSEEAEEPRGVALVLIRPDGRRVVYQWQAI